MIWIKGSGGSQYHPNYDYKNKQETVYQIYGVLKCSLLLLELHDIEPFEPEIIALILNHIDQIFNHFYMNNNHNQFAKYSVYTVKLINAEYNKWPTM